MDINVVLGATSLVLLLALVGFFGYAVREQEANEPKEEQLRGVALLRQHYPAGATLARARVVNLLAYLESIQQ